MNTLREHATPNCIDWRAEAKALRAELQRVMALMPQTEVRSESYLQISLSFAAAELDSECPAWSDADPGACSFRVAMTQCRFDIEALLRDEQAHIPVEIVFLLRQWRRRRDAHDSPGPSVRGHVEGLTRSIEVVEAALARSSD